ncbi:hypothetical protein [Fusibacter tunisiensis]|uniref:Uncharacterized protein n=1 Tax=Fusibacter tunisiensis TaxID=1008308 RepID=A0ABS2MTS2_9FIRM|nr:hypothetical protein [Fusibacter tunisiensis]MBM7562824.1 hypothetical protein [Fusibacter tunisiensis]
MLTITQVNYIRELFFLEGKTYSKINKMTGKNYRIIVKYVGMDDFNQKQHKAKRPNKSDLIRPIIRKWLIEDKSRHHKQRHTAKRVYDRLKEEHPDILKVKDRTVRSIFKEEKAAIVLEIIREEGTLAEISRKYYRTASVEPLES